MDFGRWCSVVVAFAINPWCAFPSRHATSLVAESRVPLRALGETRHQRKASPCSMRWSGHRSRRAGRESRLTLRQFFFESLRQRIAGVNTHLDWQYCPVLEHELHAYVPLDLRRRRSNGQHIKRRCGSARRLFGLVQQRDGDGRGKFGRNCDIGCGPFGPLARRGRSSLGSRPCSPLWRR